MGRRINARGRCSRGDGGLHSDLAVRLASLQLPETRKRLAVLGFDPVSNTPEQFTAYIKIEVSKWAKVIKDSGARVD
ncbi:MAG: hypothetical protein ACXWCW_24810 [Burkholderiales bacterium]